MKVSITRDSSIIESLRLKPRDVATLINVSLVMFSAAIIKQKKFLNLAAKNTWPLPTTLELASIEHPVE